MSQMLTLWSGPFDTCGLSPERHEGSNRIAWDSFVESLSLAADMTQPTCAEMAPRGFQNRWFLPLVLRTFSSAETTRFPHSKLVGNGWLLAGGLMHSLWEGLIPTAKLPRLGSLPKTGLRGSQGLHFYE